MKVPHCQGEGGSRCKDGFFRDLKALVKNSDDNKKQGEVAVDESKNLVSFSGCFPVWNLYYS